MGNTLHCRVGREAHSERPFLFSGKFQRQLFGRLSLKYMTIVAPASFNSSSFARTRPTFQSMLSHIASAARVIGIDSSSGFRFRILGSICENFSKKRSGTCIGECGVLNGK